MIDQSSIPEQKILKNSIESVPIEYFKWGTSPDHFKIDMPHRHSFVEVLFFERGGGIHEIDFEEYNIHDYSIHIVPKSTIHFLKREPSSIGYTIAFDTHYFEFNDIHKIVSPLKNSPCVLNLTEAKFNFIKEISGLLLKQTRLNKSYYKRKCFLLSTELLLNALANETEGHNSALEKKELFIQKFIDLVFENVHNYKTVSWYALQLNISPKTLSNQLKLRSGLSAKSIITDYLLKSVKKQLIHSNRPIKEIACNHNMSVSSLSKLFKKKVHVTMQEYRSI